MEKTYFPMFVDISDKKIVVIGGGPVAARRVETLCHFAEDIIVIALKFTESLLSLAAAGKICCLKRPYEEGDSSCADIVLAATDKRELNRHIWEDCRRTELKEGRRILVNVADDKELCDFYFPAVVKKNDIVIGINSGGSHPGKVKEVRRKIAQEMDKQVNPSPSCKN